MKYKSVSSITYQRENKHKHTHTPHTHTHTHTRTRTHAHTHTHVHTHKHTQPNPHTPYTHIHIHTHTRTHTHTHTRTRAQIHTNISCVLHTWHTQSSWCSDDSWRWCVWWWRIAIWNVSFIWLSFIVRDVQMTHGEDSHSYDKGVGHKVCMLVTHCYMECLILMNLMHTTQELDTQMSHCLIVSCLIRCLIRMTQEHEAHKCLIVSLSHCLMSHSYDTGVGHKVCMLVTREW